MTRWLKVRWPCDRVIALLLGVVVTPLAVVIAVVIRVVDGSPVLVRFPRVGRNGVEFRMWKFRTMHATGLDCHAGGSAITVGADVRVTPLGRKLRHHRLDEIPQLLNVVGGTMALIGPRPETPDYVDQGDQAWAEVLRARPGIAGPTQVIIHDHEAGLGVGDEGRYGAEIVPFKLAIDRWYLAHASPWIDLLVPVSLLQHFLLRRRSTLMHQRLGRDLELPDPVTTGASLQRD